MSEFTLMEDWDLQAVVRGCSTTDHAFANTMSNSINNTPSLISPLGFDQHYRDELLSTFPDCFGFATKDSDIYKPFHPDQQTLSPQSIISTTTNSPISIPRCEVKDPETKLQKKHLLPESDAPVSCSDAAAVMAAGKPKRCRKNQQKRVVNHVKADGLSSDMWAWRKYGQKPIKGSPYPRSYYRCSSSKGCLARKQVERSSSDPSVFILTYSAEHNHAHPTRRNSLAGSTRVKSSMAKQVKSNEPNMPTIKDECLYASLRTSTTPSSTASPNEDDQLVQHMRIFKNEEEKDILEDYISNDESAMPDIIFSDELFPSLEDIEGLFLDQFSTATAPY